MKGSRRIKFLIISAPSKTKSIQTIILNIIMLIVNKVKYITHQNYSFCCCDVYSFCLNKVLKK